MDAIKALKESDVLQVSSWCQYFGPPELASVFPESVLPAGCVEKPSGSLHLTLNSVKELGLAQPFNFDVELFGTVESTGTPSMPAVVRWDVNQLIDKDFVSVDGLAVHVTRVEGVVRPGVVLWSTPRQGVDCSGASRTFPGFFAWLRGFGTPPVIGTDLTFHTVIGGVTKTVTLSWNLFQAHFGSPAMGPQKMPLEAIVVHILFGGRLDTEGVTLGGGVIPPGPLPFREALDDALLGLANTRLAWAVHDPGARRRLQQAGLEAVRASVDRMLREGKEA